jgi:glycerol-3-phosphate acyltransferase PlsY
MEYVLAALMGYLLGSIPAALLVARRHGVDLRATADGNPGAWNALEQLGPRRAWPAFVLDGAKALAPALAARLAWGFWPAWAAVAGAMLGHAAPAYDPRRGGKAVMCFAGGALAMSPVAALACAVACVAVARVRGFAWGARAAVFGFPLAQLAIDPVEHVAGTGALMCLIGALFVIRRSVRASAATGGPPRA